MPPSPMAFDDERPGQSEGADTPAPVLQRRDTARRWLFGTAGAAFVGACFSALSTADFIEHLDRQVHSVHCAFLPLGGQQLGESGCRTVMLSPYSSLFRGTMWGGLPISLLALAVFSYLVFRSVDFALRKEITRKETKFLVLATLLPVMMSVIYGYISMVQIGTACKLCIGVYTASAAAAAFALLANAHAAPRNLEIVSTVGGTYARWFGEGVAFVALLTLLYIGGTPSTPKSTDGCGTLVKRDDPAGILVPLGGAAGATASIAVLDPLCPACKGFDDRLAASGLTSHLSLKAALFPLDSACNWMVKEALHPGACAVSEAILCKKDRARDILSFAFEHQEELKNQAKSDDKAIRRRLIAEYPDLERCLGSAEIKNKLNKSLRWAVANALPILTPQLFVGDRRVCDEDTDLGLEYTVARMIEQGPAKGRKSP